MSVLIDGFLIDVAIQEVHEYPSEVTSHPVEDGADVTDHIRNRPITVSLQGVVSDTPIGSVANEREADSLPSDDALAKLEQVRAAREPVTITSSLGSFQNMALQTLSVPTNASTGDALRFRAVFTQIELVTNERTTIRVEPARAQKKRRRGRKPTKNATQPDVAPVSTKSSKNASILWKLFNE